MAKRFLRSFAMLLAFCLTFISLGTMASAKRVSNWQQKEFVYTYSDDKNEELEAHIFTRGVDVSKIVLLITQSYSDSGATKSTIKDMIVEGKEYGEDIKEFEKNGGIFWIDAYENYYTAHIELDYELFNFTDEIKELELLNVWNLKDIFEGWNVKEA